MPVAQYGGGQIKRKTIDLSPGTYQLLDDRVREQNRMRNGTPFLTFSRLARTWIGSYVRREI